VDGAQATLNDDRVIASAVRELRVMRARKRRKSAFVRPDRPNFRVAASGKSALR